MNTIELMYKVIEVMAQQRIPVVFKGAMVLKHVMMTNRVVDTYRLTGDVDMDWINGSISTEELQRVIENAVTRLGIEGLIVECKREAGVNKSAGFVVKYMQNKIFSFDVSIRSNPFIANYITSSGIGFTGVSIEKMYADKASAISSKLVFRRVKDVYDLYLLSQLNGYEMKNIIDIYKFQNKELGEFKEFIQDVKNIEHVYQKMKNVVNKPDFYKAYGRARDFCMPLITNSYKYTNGRWDNKNGMWYQV